MKIIVKLSCLLIVASSLPFMGCSKKSEVAPIAEWEHFQQAYFKLSFTHPKGWTSQSDAGLLSYFSSPEAQKKFMDPYADAPDGSQLMFMYRAQDTIRTLDQELEEYVKGLKDQGFTIKQQEDRQLLGQPAKLVAYGGKLSAKVRLDVIRVFTVKDSVFYMLQFGAFNDYYDAHKVAFDSAYASYALYIPKPAGPVDPNEKPSEELQVFENDRVRFSHPVNFDVNIPAPKANVQFSLEVRGMRRDCSIQIDIRAAQGLSLEKVIEQNASSLKGRRAEGRIDNERAPYFSYSPMKGINSRMYVVVKNDKFYRIIMNYNTSVEAAYLPALEKILNSIKLK